MPRSAIRGTKTGNRREYLRKMLRAGKIHFDDVAEELGYKPLDEWTFEELAKGQIGGNPGRTNKPQWLRTAVAEEIGKRLNGEFLLQVREHLPSALKVMTDFLTDDDNPHLKFQAAKLLIEYVAGAPQKKLEIRTTSQVETLLADIVVMPDGRNAHPMIEGVVSRVKDEEMEDDDLPD